MLGAMRDDSILINVGRGCTLDEAALVEVLMERPSRRALLDVFTEEPLPSDSPLWRQPNVTITPHVAAVSYPWDVVAVFEENLQRDREGRALLHRIDIERGY
jgi:phosphoglycerate dehydrogenase-like enzyme